MSLQDDPPAIPDGHECEQKECKEHDCDGYEEAAIGCGGAGSMVTEEEFYNALPVGHMVKTFMDEHQSIRLKLDRLEVLASDLESDPGTRLKTLQEMAKLGKSLVGAEPHHQREEDVLFPALTQLGLVGPPAVMTEEHVEIRRLKHLVRDLPAGLMDNPQESTAKLIQGARYLVGMLRQHIDKENRILYPMSVQFINSEEKWATMKQKADAIGYCSFDD